VQQSDEQPQTEARVHIAHIYRQVSRGRLEQRQQKQSSSRGYEEELQAFYYLGPEGICPNPMTVG
jgi:hypothetical protein